MEQPETDEWIPVLNATLFNAFDVVLPMRHMPDFMRDASKRDETTDIPRKLLDGLIEFAKEADYTDDHSVGICTCGARDVIGDLEMARKGFRPCVKCGGTGYADGPETDSEGEPLSISCPTCDGTRRWPITQSTKGIDPGTSP